MDLLQVELADGDTAAALELMMDPYGIRPLYSADDSEDSRIILYRLAEIWRRLWPEMRSRFEEAAEHLDLEAPADGESLVAYAARLEPGIFMADRCDIYLSLSSDCEAPDWDYFLKDGQIIHFQPVF